jgi:regulator of replication initiation timing
MPYDERQAALAIARLMDEKRRLREQLSQALARVNELSDENQRLRQRVEELERVAARQAAPFRRSDKNKKDPILTITRHLND